MIRDTFDKNRGLCELFKRNMLARAAKVEYPTDLIDFEKHIDMQGTYPENLTRIYHAYPRLADGSDFLKNKPSNSELTWKEIRNMHHDFKIQQTLEAQTPSPAPERNLPRTVHGWTVLASDYVTISNVRTIN